MSRYSTSFALVLSIATVATQHAADACGVKLAIKKFRAPRDKPAPVNASEHPVVAQRQARTPIAAGPTQPPARRVVDAKPPEPKPAAFQPAPPPQPQPQPPAQPERVAVTEKTVDPERPPVAKPQPKTRGTLHDEVFFTVGSSTVGSRSALDKDVRWLLANSDTHVVVEGYADPTGTHDGNMALSRSRAEAVRDYFTAAGVDASRLDVEAYGDTRLKYGQADSRNRRVMIEVKK